jgi:hypothetical protein
VAALGWLALPQWLHLFVGWLVLIGRWSPAGTFSMAAIHWLAQDRWLLGDG